MAKLNSVAIDARGIRPRSELSFPRKALATLLMGASATFAGAQQAAQKPAPVLLASNNPPAVNIPLPPAPATSSIQRSNLLNDLTPEEYNSGKHYFFTSKNEGQVVGCHQEYDSRICTVLNLQRARQIFLSENQALASQASPILLGK